MSRVSAEEPRPSGLSLGRPFGVPIFLSWSWFAGAALITWLFAPLVENRLPALNGSSAVAVAASFAVLLGLSVLIHELAHAVMALRLGLSVRQITLHLLGGVSEIEGEQRKPWVDFVIAAVGPIASLLLAGLGFVLVQVLPDGTALNLVAFQLAVANLLVGAFNLVPGLPLDGGRMLRDVIWAASGNESTGTIAAAWTGRVLAGAIVLLAVWPILNGGTNIIWLVWGIVLASFIWIEADRALRSGRLRAALPQVNTRSLTRRAIPVAADLPISEALRQLATAQAGAIVTLDRSGQPLGVVNEAAVAAVPEVRRPWVDVSTVARALPKDATVSADLAGELLVAHLSEHPASEYLVVESDGSVYGVLARADVEAALSSLAGRR
jgi:Zn-dependent protease/CBS domain-containing protein